MSSDTDNSIKEGENVEPTSNFELVRRLLDTERYPVIHPEPIGRGGMGEIFLVEWGPGKQKRAVKVSSSPGNALAELYVLRGHTTRKELEALAALPNPGQHNIIGILDYAIEGEDVVIVEEYVKAKTLEEMIISLGPKERLDARAVERIFLPLFDAVSYLHSQGFYHRDIKPSNILIGIAECAGQVRLADLGIARKIEEASTEHYPTVGGKSFMDPRVFSSFVTEARKYDEQAEMYMIAMSLFYALTGKKMFEFNPIEHTAIECETGNTLLTSNSTIDWKKYTEIVQSSLQDIPWESRRYKPMIRRALGLMIKDSKPYSGIAEMGVEFQRLSNRRDQLVEQQGMAIGVGAFAVLGCVAIIWGGNPVSSPNYLSMYGMQGTAVIQDGNQPGKPTTLVFEPFWNRERIEIENPHFEINVIRIDDYKKRRLDIPFSPYISTEPGEELNLYFSLKEKVPISKGQVWYNYPGRVYIEGFNAVSFDDNLDYMNVDEEWRGGSGGREAFHIPTTIQSGAYTLVIEVDTPTPIYEHRTAAPYTYKPANKVFARKRIPLLIGNDKTIPYLEKVNTDRFDSGMIIRSIGDTLSIGSEYTQFSEQSQYSADIDGKVVLQDDLRTNTNSKWGRFSLDSCPKSKESTFEFISRRGGEIVYQTLLPIQIHRSEQTLDRMGKVDCQWALAIPSSDFYQLVNDRARFLRQEQWPPEDLLLDIAGVQHTKDDGRQ